MGFSTTISSLLSAVHGFMDNAYLKRDPWIKSGPAGSVKVTHHSGKLCASNLEGLQLTGAVNLRDPDDPTILKEGFKEIFLPKENADEASVIDGIKVYAASSLLEVIQHIITKEILDKNGQIVVAPLQIIPHKKNKK